jgi:hypothetical protein
MTAALSQNPTLRLVQHQLSCAAQGSVELDSRHIPTALQILHYQLPAQLHQPNSATARSNSYVRALDSALPQELHTHLREALSSGSPFWAEHNYGRVGYFSYLHRLVRPAQSQAENGSLCFHSVQALPKMDGSLASAFT